ncbi:MAG: prepilin peptidase [Verrucomicrobia bacterium]|nr:prepilin peptidase [Verrucomicrobiota bacterium]
MFDPKIWAAVPFHFWSLVFFTFGCMVGSFLNVCIHRMPRGESIVSPPSHCPHCGYAIPWYLNIPLATWLYLRGRCANCRAPISARYFLVELLTGIAFLSCWLAFGHKSAWLVFIYCLFVDGLIAATFIDFEHFIIPDEITLGGIGAGFLCSFALPLLHERKDAVGSLFASFLGIVVGGGVILAILQIGKLVFGRQKIPLPPGTRIIFTEGSLILPDSEIPYEEVFFRDSDTIRVEARTVELVDRGYWNVPVRLSPERLRVGPDELKPEEMPHMEVTADCIILPREAMGMGDVKFMAAIGAFLGWQATLFALMLSSVLGATVGVVLIALKRHEWSSRLPYGPYIAVAAVVWVFAGKRVLAALLGQ